MAQLPRIRLHKPCINLPFGDCAMYFEHRVQQNIQTTHGSFGLEGKCSRNEHMRKNGTFFHLSSLKAMFRYSDSLQTSARDIQFLSGSLLEFL